MPIYEYSCPKCGTFDHFQSISDAPLKRCPKCRSAVEKLVSMTSFQLKGGGWYADGYHKGPAGEGNGAKTDADEADTGKSETGKSGAAKTDAGAKSKKKGKTTGHSAGSSD